MILPASVQGIAWLAEKVKLPITVDFKGIEAYDSTNTLIGVVVYDKWTFNSVRIHIALDKRPSKELVRATFEYPFVQCDKGVLIAEIPASKTVPLRIATKGFGFQVLARVKDGWDVGDDLIILELRREDWRKGKGN